MSLLGKMTRWFTGPTLTKSESAAIEVAVDRVDPRLRVVSGYRRKLAASVRHAMAYCDGLVSSIPGPVDIDIRAFGADPMVHAFFSAPDDIGRMLGASLEVKQFIADPGNLRSETFHCLIGMRRKEKTVLGLGQQGSIIYEDVPQRLLYFADHTLRELSPDLDRTCQGLRASAFDSLAESFAAHVATLRHEKTHLRAAWDQERARERASSSDTERATAHDQRKIEIEQSLRDMLSTLEPAHIVEALAAWLSDPEPRLHLISTPVTVDRLGVLAAPNSDAPDVRTFELPELVGRDRRRWIVLLARIGREDALRAQQETQAAHRYLLI